MSLLNIPINLLHWLFSSKLKAIITVVLLLILGFWGVKTIGAKNQQVQYQTTQVEKGSLISSVTASGTISAGNTVNITTDATGIVSTVYVKNGDQVSQGEKIADLTLDLNSQQKLASAWSNYLQAKTGLDAAESKLNSLQASEFTANQKLINDAVARGLTTDNPVYIEENATWLQAEADYKNQASVIAQSQASLNSASLAYQQISPTIVAPTSGTITNLTLSPGVTISGNSSSSANSNSSSSSSSTSLGTITLDQNQLQATVNLTEIDVTKVSPGQKVTLTLDAFPDKTFTGKVLTIDTNGTVSSGVTTYPTTIGIDSAVNNIYPNMAVNATIITKVDTDVLTVPSSSIQTANGQSTVRVLRNGKPQTVDVQTGDSNDSDTEITSGLNEGDMVVTGTIGGSTRTGNGTTSPFGGGLRFGGGGFGGGGGAARGGGRGG